MYRSRTVLTITTSVLFVLMLGFSGWCGGPPAAAGPAFMLPGPAPFGPSEPKPFVSISAGGGPGTVDGSNASSPNVDLSDLGIDSAWVWSFGAKFVVEPFEISGNLYTGQFTGSTTYSGDTIAFADGTFMLRHGDDVDTDMTLTMWDVNADIYAFSGAPWKVGVRFQYLQLVNSFNIDNNALGSSTDGSNSYAMFGIGGVGVMELPGLGAGYYTAGLVKPRLNFSGSLGWGDGARYYAFDIFLQVFRTRASSVTSFFGSSRRAPALSGEIGWMYFKFVEDEGDRIAPTGFTAREDTAHFSLSLPVFRACLFF